MLNNKEQNTMYVIYDQATTKIIENVRYRPYRVTSHYKTMPAALAARTRMQRRYEDENGLRSADTGPLFDYGIAEVNHYHKRIERQVKRVNLMSGEEYYESVNTPNYCSPSSEAYWSM